MSSATPHIDAAKAIIAKARSQYTGRLMEPSRAGTAARISMAIQESVLLAVAIERENDTPEEEIFGALAFGIGDLLAANVAALATQEGGGRDADVAKQTLAIILKAAIERAERALDCELTRDHRSSIEHAYPKAPRPPQAGRA